METLWQDIRFAFRMFAKNPGFTLAIIISLALGIGVNTSIFSLVNAVLLKPLPVVKDPERLVWLHGPASYPNFQDYRQQSDVFSGMTAVSGTTDFSLGRDGKPEIVTGEFVTADYFSVLGVEPAVGRAFNTEEDSPGAHPVVVISHRLWQNRFGSNPDMVGEEISLNGLGFTVVGITPKGFIGTEAGLIRDLWMPMALNPVLKPDTARVARPSEPDILNRRNTHWLNVIARLKPGVSREQAEAQMVAIATHLSELNRGRSKEEFIISAGLEPVSGGLDPRDRADALPIAGLLMAVVSLVLLIACANAASLLLARASMRQKEIAIRQAMGAGRARLIRQLMTEAALLTLMGGMAGLLLALWSRDLIIAFGGSTPIVNLDVSVDQNVLGFTLLASLLTGVTFGLVPALQSSRLDLVPALKQESVVMGRSYRRSRLRNLLVAAQVALSFLLLIGTGLFLRSLQSAQSVDPGFVAENGLTVPLDLELLRYQEERGQAAYRQVVERVEALPGVKQASLTRFLPLGNSFGQTEVSLASSDSSTANQSISVGFNIVGAGYFQTMGVPILRGREFSQTDDKGAPGVVVINETLAEQAWPGEDPVGKRISFGDASHAYSEVIGVARNAKYASLGERPRPFIYQPLLQSYEPKMALIVRTTSEPQALIEGVRDQVQALEPNLPLSDTKTLADVVGLSLFPARLAALLLAIFGLLALALAAVGIHGVVAYSVNQRTQEIGIRMALGAQPSHVLKLVVKEGAIIVGSGIGAGLVMALASTRLASSFLYGISPTDPITFTAISLLLVGVALGASFIPVRRAIKVDPMVALRYE